MFSKATEIILGSHRWTERSRNDYTFQTNRHAQSVISPLSKNQSIFFSPSLHDARRDLERMEKRVLDFSSQIPKEEEEEGGRSHHLPISIELAHIPKIKSLPIDSCLKYFTFPQAATPSNNERTIWGGGLSLPKVTYVTSYLHNAL